MEPVDDFPRALLVGELRERLAQLAAERRSTDDVISTGLAEFDQLLPGGGLRRGTLVEWLSAAPGSGAGTLALAAARQAVQQQAVQRQGTLVVVDPQRRFYPPAAARAGLDLRRTVIVWPGSQRDTDWTLAQALRWPGVTAVLGWIDRASGRALRRWQLAAEASGALGLLVRPDTVRAEPSWAEARLLVEPVAANHALAAPPRRRRLRIRALRLRGGQEGGALEVDVDDETGAVHLAAAMAAPTSRARAAGA